MNLFSGDVATIISFTNAVISFAAAIFPFLKKSERAKKWPFYLPEIDNNLNRLYSFLINNAAS